MASHLILDRKDEGINGMVAEWVNGETYDLRVKVVQTESDEKFSRFEVTEAINETSEEPEEEAPPEGDYSETPPPKAKGPPKPMVKPMMTIAFHK